MTLTLTKIMKTYLEPFVEVGRAREAQWNEHLTPYPDPYAHYQYADVAAGLVMATATAMVKRGLTPYTVRMGVSSEDHLRFVEDEVTQELRKYVPAATAKVIGDATSRKLKHFSLHLDAATHFNRDKRIPQNLPPKLRKSLELALAVNLAQPTFEEVAQAGLILGVQRVRTHEIYTTCTRTLNIPFTKNNILWRVDALPTYGGVIIKSYARLVCTPVHYI